MDLVDLAMLGYGLLSLGIAIVALAWPLKSERDETRGVMRARWSR